MTLTFGSLFAGIGGLDLGLERAGMQCAWQVEIDDYATKVLAKHWPNVHRERDVRTCGAANLAAVDLICGGFPCQDISQANTSGQGIDGARSGLWRDFARIIGELRPRFVLVENTTALSRRGIDRVLGDMAEIGYDAEWEAIPACAFGAPHTRERVFIVGYTSNLMVRARANQPARMGETASGAGDGWQGSVFRPAAHSNSEAWRQNEWPPEPAISRMAHGIPRQLDRLRGLGNAVVPQVAEFIGRQIVEFDNAR